VAFAGQTVDEITDTILGYWSAEYAAATPPRVLLISRGSDAWMWARGLAVIFQGLSAQAEQNSHDILPDEASDAAVERFGNVYGVPRRPGVAAQQSVQVTGTPSTAVAIPFGSDMAWSDGTLYQALDTSVVLDGAGEGIISVESTTLGASTTRDASDVLTWQSAPAGLDPTATVISTLTTGADVESYGDWAQRIIGRLQERPASGNRADWKAWCEAFTGLDIRQVWVYPLLQPPATYPGAGTENVLGCVTVVCAGPAQGDNPENSRSIGASGASLDTVKAYIEGLINAEGLVVTDGEQLRPVTMASADYGIETITEQTPTNVQITLICNTANRFSFSNAFTPVVDATSTRFSLVVVGDWTATGNDLSTLAALVNVGTAFYRGGFYRVVLPTGVYNGGTNLTTWDLTATPFPVGSAPVAASSMSAAPGCWGSLRLAVFDYFDALGPGDTTPPGRFPSEDSDARSTFYRDALRGILANVPGVLSANVTAPVADQTPLPKKVVTLGTLLVVGL
jgi:uncharacterized phage protein gp47/JayE